MLTHTTISAKNEKDAGEIVNAHGLGAAVPREANTTGAVEVALVNTLKNHRGCTTNIVVDLRESASCLLRA